MNNSTDQYRYIESTCTIYLGTLNNWNHHQTNNSEYQYMYCHTIFHSWYMFSLGNSLQEYFKSSLVLAKMKVKRPVYDMEFRQFPCWDGHVQILCLFNCLALFYKHAFAFQPLINFEKRLFKLDSSTEVRNFEIIVSISVFRCFIVDSNIVFYPAFSWQDVTFVININWFRFP